MEPLTHVTDPLKSSSTFRLASYKRVPGSRFRGSSHGFVQVDRATPLFSSALQTTDRSRWPLRGRLGSDASAMKHTRHLSMPINGQGF